MTKKDKRVDAYIEKAQDFAKPILNHLRSVVHKASGDIVETIKWGMPYFEYNGKMLCGIASFKEHCAFVFRLGGLMKDPKGLMERASERTGMGHFGKIRGLKDLPSEKVLIEYVKEAIALTDGGAKIPDTKAAGAKEISVPEDFMKLLKKNKASCEAFDKFSYSRKKEYVEWIMEAKTPETRNKRMATAVEWIAEGKGRNWKYTKQGR